MWPFNHPKPNRCPFDPLEPKTPYMELVQGILYSSENSVIVCHAYTSGPYPHKIIYKTKNNNFFKVLVSIYSTKVTDIGDYILTPISKSQVLLEIWKIRQDPHTLIRFNSTYELGLEIA